MDIIVVEGIHDLARIKALFKDSLVITTNGSEISTATLKMLEAYAKTNKIIIFTDPDYPGERIRNKIKQICPNAYEAFIPKNLCISKNKKKVGVEHASDEDIKASLAKIYSSSKPNNFWNLDKLIKLGLAGENLAAQKRNFISEKLNIGRPNTKTFISRLNNFNITFEQVKELIDLYGSQS